MYNKGRKMENCGKEERFMSGIKDVAELAGVSVTTVSRVLNKRGYISQATYNKVYQAIDQLDYQPNQVARSLQNQKTYFVGLLIPDISHPFFSELTKRIELLLYQSGYKLLLCNTKEKANREHDYLNMLRQNKVDGIIIGTHMLETSEYEKISLPVVAMDMFLGEQIPTICVDHEKGGRMAAEEFVQNGCRCVLQIRGNTDVKTPALLRHNSFKEVLEQNHIRCIDYELKTNEFARSEYYGIMNEIFDKYPEIDGAFSTDIIIVNAVRCALERGIPVPEKFKAVGYDGVDIAKMCYPSLTHIAQPFDLLAEKLVDTLLRKIEGEPITENIILSDVKLVKGHTTF